MKRIAKLVSLALLCTSLTALANPIALRKDHPYTYTVQKGDTLWGISGKFLQNPLQWPRLMQANPEVQSPYLLYPGQVLEFSLHNGEPQLHVVSNGVIKLSPQIQVTRLNPIPTLPADYIKPFVNSTRVVNRDDFNKQPYVVAQADEHVVTGAGDRLYVVGFTDPNKIAENYALFRLGSAYTLPGTKKVLGYQATSVGQLHLTQPGNPATFEITRSDREAEIGDRLLPIDDATVNLNFTPQFPPPNIQGQIIGVLDGTTQVGSLSNVVIDLGSTSGIVAGDVLAAYRVGQVIPDPEAAKNLTGRSKAIKLPDERKGVMIIYRVYPQVSYGLVLYERGPLNLYDIVRSPQAPTTLNQNQG